MHPSTAHSEPHKFVSRDSSGNKQPAKAPGCSGLHPTLYFSLPASTWPSEILSMPNQLKSSGTQRHTWPTIMCHSNIWQANHHTLLWEFRSINTFQMTFLLIALSSCIWVCFTYSYNGLSTISEHNHQFYLLIFSCIALKFLEAGFILEKLNKHYLAKQIFMLAAWHSPAGLAALRGIKC